MRKKKLLFLLGLTAVLVVTGCGSDKTPETEPASVSVEEESEDFEEYTVIEETEEVLEPIDPSTYLISDIDKYVTLNDYSKLSATQYTYEITDSEFQERIQLDREECADETPVERASQTGDVVYADVSASIEGEDEDSDIESYFVILGEEENGAEFDKELTGVSVGDHKTFSAAFGEEIWRDEWIGKTVKFDVTVTDVMERMIPEYNDQYVSEYTEFETVAEYEKHLRETMEKENDVTSFGDVYEELLSQVEAAAIFASVPEDLQAQCKDEILYSYKIFFGQDATMQDITDLFGYTEEQLAIDAVPMAQRRLIVSALCEANRISVSSDEYFAYLAEQADYYGNESAGDYEKTTGRSTVVWALYEKKAAEYLYNTASIRKVPYTEDEADAEEAEIVE